VMGARAVAWSEILSAGFGNPLVVDGAKFCDAFLAELLPERFADLAIPLTVIAADLHAREALAFSEGPLKPAVAASMAVPGLIRPIERDGRVLVDGGVVDPLPFTVLRGKADAILAVDVSGGAAEAQSVPDPWESLFAAITVMGHAIVAEKLKSGAPDLLVRPNIGIFRMLDFFQASAILRAAEPVKVEVKQKLGALLGAG
jgi:NTE family protein